MGDSVLRKHWKRWLAVAIVVAVAGALVPLAGKFLAYGRIAAGYTAQQTCSCLHVSRRPLASCLAEYPPDQIKLIAFDTAGDRVRITAFGVFHGESVFEEGYGCQPVK